VKIATFAKPQNVMHYFRQQQNTQLKKDENEKEPYYSWTIRNYGKLFKS
jgi:hypothetical protein